MDKSLEDIFNEIMDISMEYLFQSGKLDNQLPNASPLIDVIELLPGLVHKYVNGLGSLAWILEWTPDKMENYLNQELENVKMLVKNEH